MSSKSNAPVIIRRKKVIAGGGHHGGAWKVAYADFVTAMMAFFLLMWLLNATSETKRQGIADYFSPTIPIVRTSGGGSGALGGSDLYSDNQALSSGIGGAGSANADAQASDSEKLAGLEVEPLPSALAEIEDALSGRSGESMVSDELVKHIVTRVTDQGLIVDLFDLPGAQLFANGSTVPTPLMRDLTSVVSEIFALAENEIAINGHVRADPVVLRDSRVWDLSASRAQETRGLMTRRHVDQKRIQRIGGYADREPSHVDRMDIRNNRIEVILLRDTGPGKR